MLLKYVKVTFWQKQNTDYFKSQKNAEIEAKSGRQVSISSSNKLKKEKFLPLFPKFH